MKIGKTHVLYGCRSSVADDFAIDPVVGYEQTDSIVVVTLNQPEVLNALNRDLINVLSVAITCFYSVYDTRVAAITGAGKAFCAARDLTEYVANSKAGIEFHARSWKMHRFRSTLLRILPIAALR